MTDTRLLVFAHGRPGQWEAICVDLDIAVQGESQEEVLSLMQTSIQEYLTEVAVEAPADRRRLLTRRVPWHVRLKLVVGFFLHTLRRRGGNDYRAISELPCPA